MPISCSRGGGCIVAANWKAALQHHCCQSRSRMPLQIQRSGEENPNSYDAASSISIWVTRGCASKVSPIRSACARRCKSCCDDCAANRDTDLDRCRCHGSAAWFHRSECHHTDGLERESVFRSRLCLPWTTWRSDQTALVRWGRIVSIFETIGARTFHLAAGHRRHSVADAGPTFDAAGGY